MTKTNRRCLRSSLVLAFVLTLGACDAGLTVTPVSTLLSRGDGTVAWVRGRMTTGAWEVPGAGLIVQNLTDETTDTVSIVMKDSLASGAMVAVHGRLRIADFAGTGRDAPFLVADSVQIAGAQTTSTSSGPLLSTIGLVLSLLVLSAWFAWRVDIRERLRRRPLNLAALRESVADAEGDEKEKEKARGLQKITERDTFLVEELALKTGELSDLADAPGDTAADRNTARMTGLLGDVLIPLDLVAQIATTYRSESGVTWQSATAQAIGYTALFAFVGWATGKKLLRKTLKTRRAIRLSNRTADTLFWSFVITTILFAVVRALGGKQLGVFGDYAYLLFLGLLALALAAGLYKATSSMLSEKDKLRADIFDFTTERERNSAVVGEFGGSDDVDDSEAAPPTPPPTSRSSNSSLGNAAAIALLFATLTAPLSYAAPQERGLTPARKSVASVVTVRDAPTAKLCAPYFLDQTASLDRVQRAVADSLYVSSLADEQRISGCSTHQFFPFTSDTVFWFGTPKKLDVPIVQREIAVPWRCPPADLSRLGPIIAIGNAVTEAKEAALRDCQRNMDLEFSNRFLGRNRLLKEAHRYLAELKTGGADVHTDLAAIIQYAVNNAFSAAVIRTDGCHTSNESVPSIDLKTTTIVFLLVSSDSLTYGGPEASRKCAEAWTGKLRGRYLVMPYTTFSGDSWADILLTAAPRS